MNYKKNYQNLFIFCSLIIFIYTFYLLTINFSNQEGYWFDEWCTLLNTDPNVDLNIFFNRLEGNHEKPPENVPPIYYLVLRFFFKIFGYSSENGRFFSLIFFILSTFTFYFLLNIFLNKSQSLFVSSIFFSCPLIFWMSNETRIDMFLLFFSLLNILVFLKLIKKNSTINKINLFLINVILMSLYPLTISLVFSQFFYAVYKKNISFALIIVVSILVYFFFNYEYFLDKAINSDNHHTILNLNFFIGYFFNTFFGSIYFGFIYLIFFVFFVFRNLNKILKNEILFYFLLCIIFTYLMIIISSLFITPIASPRYIIFIIPIILALLFSIIYLYEKNHIFVIIFFIISTTNISINYNKQPIQKPKIYEALGLIKNLNEKYIYIEPQEKLFTNYISTIKQISNFTILNEKEIIKNNISSFAVLCLNYPSFAYKLKPKNINKDCLDNFNGYKEIKTINFNDFFIRHLKLKINL